MENKGWIKLHRKFVENEVWRKDRTAWQIFEYLLARAYIGKPPGKVSTTRQQIAQACFINNNTVYNALNRLKTARMLTTSSTTKNTLVTICNWELYQSAVNKPINNGSTTNQQRRPPLVATKSIDNKSNTTNVVLAQEPKRAYGNENINQVFAYWEKTVGLPIAAKQQRNRNAASNLIKKYTVKGVEQLIDGVALAAGDQYAPRIADFTQLQAKLNELLLWGKKKKAGGLTSV